MVHPELHAVLRPYLLRGERLVWAGRPKRGLVFQAGDLIAVPFSLVWTAVAASIALADRPWLRDPLSLAFSILFAASAIYMTVGRFVQDAWLRSRLFYAVTNRRVLMLRAGPFSRLRALELRYLPVLDLSERGSGRGTILFDTPPAGEFWEGKIHLEWAPAASKLPRFLDIESARDVYELIARECERVRREALAALPQERRDFIG
jgi:hypothetical protein